MGFVLIRDTMVDSFERGLVVAEEWFGDIERLVGLGAVERVDPRDVPTDAVQPPDTTSAPVEAAPETPPEPSASAEPPVIEESPAPVEPTPVDAPSTPAPAVEQVVSPKLSAAGGETPA